MRSNPRAPGKDEALGVRSHEALLQDETGRRIQMETSFWGVRDDPTSVTPR